MNIEEIGNIKLPEDFKLMLKQFENEFGEDGFSKLASYIGFDWVANKDEVRDYELVPFEAVLPFPTGSNGEHMGWLNLCPNLAEFKKPFICWVPLGEHIFYHGTEVTEILANSVERLHSPNYEDIDLDFLNKLGVFPQNANKVILVNYDDEPLNKIELRLPKEYQYEITIDGVGVIANEKYFSTEFKYEQTKLSISQYIEIAKETFKQSNYGTTMFYLKEGYYRNFFETDKQDQILEILKLKEETYTKLAMKEAAEQVNIEIKKREPSR
jgi:hypothetical protein